MRYHAFFLLALSVYGTLATARADNAKLEAFPVLPKCGEPGKFVEWRGSDELAISVDARLVTCNTQTGERKPTEPTVSEGDDVRYARLKAYKDTFPGTIREVNSQTGSLVEWTNIVPLLFPMNSSDALIPEKELSRQAQADLQIFTTDGPPRNGQGGGQRGHRLGAYALFFRENNGFRRADLEFSPHSPTSVNSAMIYPWQLLDFRVDGSTGRILIFFSRVSLASDERNNPGWGPFNSWWLNPQAMATQHVVLPDGPWVKDASSFSPFRTFRDFPVGVEGQYDIKVGGGRIFILITAADKALKESTTGLYVLETKANTWTKIASADVGLERVGPDGCKLAIERSARVAVLNLCP